MIKYLSVLLCLTFYITKATNFTEVDVLIKQKQYLNAWKKLEELESGSNKLDVNLKKIDLCLKYSTKTVSHQAFGFTNVPNGESLSKQRQIATKKLIPVLPFKIDKILDSLIIQFPNNYTLQKIKGDFYYDVYIIYGKDWKVNDMEVLRRMHDSYTLADKQGVNDYISLYALGYFFNFNKQNEKAIQYFKRSLDLNPNYAATHYNLAYLYIERDSIETALDHSLKAYKKYKYKTQKNDAGQMAASLLSKLNKHNEAIPILLECDQLIPGSYQTYYYLLTSFLSLNKLKEAGVTTNLMFDNDAKSHSVNSDLINLHLETNHLDELLKFYNKKLEEEKYDMEFRGHIQLHIAQAYTSASNKEKSAEYIELARQSFNTCYDSGHPVFRVLKKMENQ